MTDEKELDESLNARDVSKDSIKYFREDLVLRRAIESDLDNYKGLTEDERQKLSYRQYNQSNLPHFMTDYTIPLRDRAIMKH